MAVCLLVCRCVCVCQAEVTIGELTAFLLYVVVVATNLGMLSSLWPAFMIAVGASTKVFYLLDRIPAINFEGGEVPSGAVKGEIVLTNVWFRYPRRRKSGSGGDRGDGQIAEELGKAGMHRSAALVKQGSGRAGGRPAAAAVPELDVRVDYDDDDDDKDDVRTGKAPHQWVLQDISLHIAPGTTVALVSFR